MSGVFGGDGEPCAWFATTLRVPWFRRGRMNCCSALRCYRGSGRLLWRCTCKSSLLLNIDLLYCVLRVLIGRSSRGRKLVGCAVLFEVVGTCGLLVSSDGVKGFLERGFVLHLVVPDVVQRGWCDVGNDSDQIVLSGRQDLQASQEVCRFVYRRDYFLKDKRAGY